MRSVDRNTKICYRCVGDIYLSEDVRNQGKRVTCEYCGKRRKCLTIEEISERIDEILSEHFELTPSEPTALEYILAKEGLWLRSGERVENLIAEIAGVTEEIAGDIRHYLSGLYGYTAVRDGEEDPYDSLACYRERIPDELAFRESWSIFRSEIRSRARFFSPHAKDALDEIFGEVASLKTWDGISAIRDIKPTDDDRYIYRARVVFQDKDLQEILREPTSMHGPPPSRKAKAGRMNAGGIPVFYGAMDESTCIAEARAPVGSHVILGRYEVLRSLKLLDFDVLTKICVEGSHFDPDYHRRCGRAAFLRRMVREVSRPVMPGDEEFQYLPTQAIAEYLAGHVEPRLDGIIFHSSQTAGEGRNIVLFNHACGVEKYSLPKGTEFSFLIGMGADDDFDPDITVFETVPDQEASESAKGKRGPASALDMFDVSAIEDALNWEEKALDEPPGHESPTLRLDVSEMRVLNVESVSYKYNVGRVHRSRSIKGEETDF